ncbi:hypothetical protein CLOP_g23781 [Closterium sp. NIES-67]|nr:hypothetical protein CLOP_g23781 [Closterium sp. NIES-67]
MSPSLPCPRQFCHPYFLSLNHFSLPPPVITSLSPADSPPLPPPNLHTPLNLHTTPLIHASLLHPAPRLCVSLLDLTQQLSPSPAAIMTPGIHPAPAVATAAVLANSISEAEKGILGRDQGPKNAEVGDQSGRGEGDGGARMGKQVSGAARVCKPEVV